MAKPAEAAQCTPDEETPLIQGGKGSGRSREEVVIVVTKKQNNAVEGEGEGEGEEDDDGSIGMASPGGKRNSVEFAQAQSPPPILRENDNSLPFDEQQQSRTKRKPAAKPPSNFNGFALLYDDIVNFNSREGSIPHSLVIGSVIAITCGTAAYLYYTALFALLELIWHTIPKHFVVGVWPESLYVLWIPIVCFTMAICVGLSVIYLGEPGDLAFTIKCVHEKAYVELNHVLPMVFASLFSIIGGGSLGPEAPLVAICAALAGFVSRNVFRQHDRNLIRKHTLMGMAGALAAFFGAPLGGSLFALEVCSKFGIEYFEHTIEAIFVGIMTVTVFRLLANLPMEPIWSITTDKMPNIEVVDLGVGAVLGLLGALTGVIFTLGHWKLMESLDYFGLLDNRYAIPRALVGATVITTMGVLIPHTLFWGEAEIQQIATASPASELPHVFPTGGALNFEMTDALHSFLVGVAKLVAISFTVAGGYRGGFIFPLFSVGCAFGRSLVYVFPWLNPSLACLCMAAATNVAITKTSLATPLILVFLSGDEYALPAVLTAALVSLFATAYMPFIKTQVSREDISQSLLPRYDDYVDDDEASFLTSMSRTRVASRRMTILVDEPEEAANIADMFDSFLSEDAIGSRRSRSGSFAMRMPTDISDRSDLQRGVVHRPSLRDLTGRSYLG